MELAHRRPTELELYDAGEGPEALRRGAREDAWRQREGSVGKVRLGKRLSRIEAEGRYRDFGYGSFAAYLGSAEGQGELGFGERQARNYMALAGLELGPLWGTDYPLSRLQALARRRAADEVQPRPRGKRAPRPSRLAAQVGRHLLQVEELLPRLGLGQGKDHQCLQEVEDALRRVLRKYLAHSGGTVEALLAERRERDRGGDRSGGTGSGLPADEDRCDVREIGEDPRGRGAPESAAPAVAVAEAPEPATPAVAVAEAPEPATPAVAVAGAPGPATPAVAVAAAPEVPWHVPVVRAVVAALAPAEVPQLERHLLLALSGRAPTELVTFVRGVGARLADRGLRADLGCWLRQAANRDLEARWPYLYMFFSAAALPQFRFHLHLLRAVALPPSALSILRAAWAYFPLEEDREAPPEERAAARLAAFIDKCQPARVESMGWAYVEAAELRDALALRLGPAREGGDRTGC